MINFNSKDQKNVEHAISISSSEKAIFFNLKKNIDQYIVNLKPKFSTGKNYDINYGIVSGTLHVQFYFIVFFNYFFFTTKAVHRFYSQEQFWIIQWKLHGAAFLLLPNNVINSVQKIH